MKILVMSPKGGVGKTKISLGLASVAHKRGKSVLAIDFDDQNSLDTTLRGIDDIDNAAGHPRELMDAIEQTGDDHDVVIFDVRPGSEYTKEYLQAAKHVDFTVVPIQHDGEAILSAEYMVDQFLDEGVQNFGVVMNSVLPNEKHLSKVREKMADLSGPELQWPMLDSILQFRTVWGHITFARDRSKTLIHHHKDGKAKAEIEALYDEIVSKIGGGSR
ncbi:ParA family protein [Tranquillimonas alkanivorans]|uniref:Cellulose biosynthesis protein BcsQ n=1 Tax=Tranquillimonas alkanivorans TaxID=441119 RepID=A0A1I5W382_9RHOB|nr:ParA family protein [Tranquillimonas alkanivorans]SFQ14185.1 Cellulose biosynthesis protein BcsQ [Tranquillimonas alkanivorans]